MSTTAGKRGKRKALASEDSNAKAKTKKPRKPKGMPDFKPGEILVDLLKKKWRLGGLFGWGGFGALYYGNTLRTKCFTLSWVSESLVISKLERVNINVHLKNSLLHSII